ncbi:MAG TPA: phosphoenolpyruvate carboxylase [Candidatus Dormibacteraeota bacterium]|nr:phosphoenolpyruvate carboxylase [Candidatus Dormibacteraeota bacterium]
MPEPMRRDVRLLGEMLGQVLAESSGPELLADVERLRRSVIAARDSAEQDRAAVELVSSWPLGRAEEVARAFTCYFHLANLAEEHHRARILRERDSAPGALRDSLAAAVAEIRERQGEGALRALLDGLEVHPVLTAHPTEARRRAVVTAIRRIGEQLERLDDPRCSGSEERDARRRLLEQIELLWRTAQLRSTEVRPLDEVRTTLAVFDETLLDAVPAIYRELDTALSPADAGARPPLAPAFLRFGTWVGGDRDGNPSVTAAVTGESMRVQAEQALAALEAVVARVGRTLTADVASTPPSPGLERRLEAAGAADPGRLGDLAARSPGEPHRQFLLHVADRVRATRLGGPGAYGRPAELLDDLRAAQSSLAEAGAARPAYGDLQELIWWVETFGFHLAELEVRQHSRVLGRALVEVRAGGPRSADTEEVLATLRTMTELQRRHGPHACRRWVVSFTTSAADVAAVHELAAAAGGPPALDVVPLLETAAELARATALMDQVMDVPAVRRRLRETDGRLEVMLGYSDSAKEGGPVFATLALFQAQAELASWAAGRGLRLTLFHGRGGALGRGGGPANRAVLAQAPGSVNGRFKVTEQGEVVFARYGNPAIARRHLEQVSSAVLLASSPWVQERASGATRRFAALAASIAPAARSAYRELVETDGFASWFALVSPIEELSSLRIGSRPARRGGSRSLDDLRAIPWVFAWSQTRLNLPGWYGLGSGLAAADPAELKDAYADWPLFTSLVDNAEMSLAKTDRRIAARYLALGNRPDLAARVLAEYDLTLERLLAVTGQSRVLEGRRVLGRAVELRNPYVDALSHLQLRALRALREDPAAADRERLERLLLLTVNGVAAGLQNTG